MYSCPCLSVRHTLQIHPTVNRYRPCQVLVLEATRSIKKARPLSCLPCLGLCSTRLLIVISPSIAYLSSYIKIFSTRVCLYSPRQTYLPLTLMPLCPCPSTTNSPQSLSSVSTENRIQMHPELGRMQTSMLYTTSLSPRSWEKLTASKSKLREKTDKLILRPDLDALAEVFVCCSGCCACERQ
jgi:hypothetical protein